MERDHIESHRVSIKEFTVETGPWILHTPLRDGRAQDTPFPVRFTFGQTVSLSVLNRKHP